ELQSMASELAVEPQSGANLQGVVFVLIIQCEDEADRPNKMRLLTQQSLPLPKRFAYQADFGVLQVTQAAVDDARRSACSSGGKVVLLQQKRPAPRANALASYGDTVDAAADHHYVELLSCERGPKHGACTHPELDARKASPEELFHDFPSAYGSYRLV